jgi:hypothetical protein
MKIVKPAIFGVVIMTGWYFWLKRMFEVVNKAKT